MTATDVLDKLRALAQLPAESLTAALTHSAQFERTPARWRRPSVPPGSHPPQW